MVPCLLTHEHPQQYIAKHHLVFTRRRQCIVQRINRDICDERAILIILKFDV